LKEANFFAFTFDYWTSLALKSFLTLTIYLCNHDFRLENFVLKTIEAPNSHTGPNTADLIKLILKEYDLCDNSGYKFVAISDSVSNMVKAVKILKYPHIRCFAHLLHNCFKHSFQAPEIKKLMDKARQLIIYFRSSSQKSAKLISVQKMLNIPEIKLKLGVDVRWSSHFDSIDRLLQCRQAIINIALDDGEVTKLQLELDEWNALKSFKDIIEILQTSQGPSVSLLKPLMSSIIKGILDITNTDGDYTQTIKCLRDAFKMHESDND